MLCGCRKNVSHIGYNGLYVSKARALVTRF